MQCIYSDFAVVNKNASLKIQMDANKFFFFIVEYNFT